MKNVLFQLASSAGAKVRSPLGDRAPPSPSLRSPRSSFGVSSTKPKTRQDNDALSAARTDDSADRRYRARYLTVINISKVGPLISALREADRDFEQSVVLFPWLYP